MSNSINLLSLSESCEGNYEAMVAKASEAIRDFLTNDKANDEALLQYLCDSFTNEKGEPISVLTPESLYLGFVQHTGMNANEAKGAIIRNRISKVIAANPDLFHNGRRSGIHFLPHSSAAAKAQIAGSRAMAAARKAFLATDAGMKLQAAQAEALAEAKKMKLAAKASEA
jgi:hypothetical protein